MVLFSVIRKFSRPYGHCILQMRIKIAESSLINLRVVSSNQIALLLGIQVLKLESYRRLVSEAVGKIEVKIPWLNHVRTSR